MDSEPRATQDAGHGAGGDWDTCRLSSVLLSPADRGWQEPAHLIWHGGNPSVPGTVSPGTARGAAVISEGPRPHRGRSAEQTWVLDSGGGAPSLPSRRPAPPLCLGAAHPQGDKLLKALQVVSAVSNSGDAPTRSHEQAAASHNLYGTEVGSATGCQRDHRGCGKQTSQRLPSCLHRISAGSVDNSQKHL